LFLEYFRNGNFLQFCTASDTINDVSRFLWHQLGLASCELHDLLDGDLCKKNVDYLLPGIKSRDTARAQRLFQIGLTEM